MVLLIGDVGAGNVEFAYTSAVMLSMLRSDPAKNNNVKNQLSSLLTEKDILKIPENICYISMMREKEDILSELELSFPPEFATLMSQNMFFKINIQKSSEVVEVFKELVMVIEEHAANSLVIIDSLTNLIRICTGSTEWNELIFFLEDLQQRSKKWDGLIYILLGKNIFGSMKEEELMDISDGVLIFDWMQEDFMRHQTMIIKKFRGLMPHLTKENIVRFDTMVTDSDGFSLINVKHISGRK
ncbi:MAG: hypothetical protein J5U17_08795 [Candidatus Methanoperedens sp.]|nr:hypothetical protein [Candidatus Methanoperedens sp.]